MSILKAANVPIIGGHHVLALQGSPEGWQATPLLERCGEHAGRQGARGVAARALSGRDQRIDEDGRSEPGADAVDFERSLGVARPRRTSAGVAEQLNDPGARKAVL